MSDFTLLEISWAMISSHPRGKAKPSPAKTSPARPSQPSQLMQAKAIHLLGAEIRPVNSNLLVEVKLLFLNQTGVGQVIKLEVASSSDYVGD